ncbi:MAG: EAL domain-containing protein [Gammaproteobacteria bacterium]
MFDARRPFDPGTDGSEQLLGDTDGQPGYGPDACRLLEPLHASLESLVSSFVERFFDEQLAGSSGAGQVLASLTPDNREGLQQALANHFRLLIDPHLDAATHHATAARVGRVHAMAGIEPTWLIDAYSQWTNMVQSRLVHAGLAHAVLSHRVGMDLQAQLSGFETIEEGRQDVLRRLDALAWRAQSFADLAQGVVDALAGLDEVVAATIGRPGEGPQFQFEFVAGDTFKAYLDEVSAGKARTIVTDPSHPQGQGPTGRAWRSGQIERTVNYASDPRMEPWRSTAARLGVRSNVAIPLAPPEGVAHVVLTLYSSYAGGFSSRAHKAMLRHLRHVLGLALLRLDPKAEAAAPLPYQIRRQWRSLLEDGGLIMYYQPVIDLRTGRPVSMESLARLRDGTGELILPDRFLPTFTNEDMRRLFDLGLNQALRHLLEWDREGLELKVSLNLPSQGLMDSRYIGLVEHALARTSLAPDRLLLEVLESGEIEDEQARDRAIAGFKALGVQLAEDDLGSGHSSLLRLDQLPFDWVKIDQALVRRGPDDALRTLVFIRHLTRLAEDMGKVVVVEGLENQGLVEAAAMLGAGHGQGHAISPPMPPQEVPGWVGGFQLSLEPMQPATALGTLASYMLFNEQITASIRDPDALERLLEMPCPAMHYIEAVGLAGQPLERAHRNLTALARRGLERREFVRARNKLVNLLIDRIRLEA